MKRGDDLLEAGPPPLAPQQDHGLPRGCMTLAREEGNVKMAVKVTVVEEKGRFVVRGDGKRLDAFATRKEVDSFRRAFEFMDHADRQVDRLVKRLLRLAKAAGLTKRDAREHIEFCLLVPA